MKNAHLRFLPITFHQQRRDSSTRITAYCDRFAADEDKTHLLSLTANDSVMAAFTAAIAEQLSFDICLPGQAEQSISLGENAHTWKTSIPMPGRKQPLRHVVVLSEELRFNNSETGVFILNGRTDFAWAVLTSKLGLPACPAWGNYMMARIEEEKRIDDLTGYNCNPVRIRVSRDEMLQWIGDGVREGFLGLPRKTAPSSGPTLSSRTFSFPPPNSSALQRPPSKRSLAAARPSKTLSNWSKLADFVEVFLFTNRTVRILVLVIRDVCRLFRELRVFRVCATMEPSCR